MRCDDIGSLSAKKCVKIENPRGNINININKDVTNRKKDQADKLKPEQITQIQPQKLTLNLRSGEAPPRVRQYRDGSLNRG